MDLTKTLSNSFSPINPIPAKTIYFKKMEKRTDVEIIKSDVAEIKAALLGNEYNRIGIIQRVDRLEKKQKGTDVKIAIAAGFWAGMSFVLTKIFK